MLHFKLLIPLVLVVLHGAAVLAAESAPPAGPKVEPAAEAGDGSVLELFGHQPVKQVAATPETQRELRRPKSAEKPLSPVGSASAAGERRPIEHRAGSTASPWRLSDALPLLVVLALILAGAWAIKRLLPRRGLLGSAALELIARVPLSGRQSIVLVRLGRRVLLLGVTPEHVSTLCLVDDPEQAATLLGELASQRPGSSTQAFLSSMLDEAGRYRAAEGPEADPATAAHGHVRGLLDKVRQLARGPGAV